MQGGGVGGGGCDGQAQSPPRGTFPGTSGVPPRRFSGNAVVVDETPRGQRCVRPAAGPAGVRRSGSMSQGFEVRLDVDGRKAAAGPAHRGAVPAHQGPLDVPGNVLAAHRRPGNEPGIGRERHGDVTGRGQTARSGGAWAPFTAHFSKSVKLGSNLPPGRTDCRDSRISSLLAFS